MGRVVFECEKNHKPNFGSNGFVKMVDASDISLHSSLSKVSYETTASRKGLDYYTVSCYVL